MPAATGGRPGDAGVEREQVHHSAVKGHLLRRVVVVLIVGGSLRAIQTERIGRAGAVGRIQIGIGVAECADNAVDAGVLGSGVKAGSPAGLVALG